MKAYLLYLENNEELWFDHIGIYYSYDDAYSAAIIYIIEEAKKDINNSYLDLYNEVLNLFVNGQKQEAIKYYNQQIAYSNQIYTYLKIQKFEIKNVEEPKITKNFALKLSIFK